MLASVCCLALIRQIPRHPRALKSALDEPRDGKERENEGLGEDGSFNGKERRSEREREKRERTERTLGEGTVQGVSCVVTLLGDEANMHALDPAKVHLDRIALHYAVLQRCSLSLSYGATDRWRRVEQVKEEGTEPLVTSCVPCHHPASLPPSRDPLTFTLSRCGQPRPTSSRFSNGKGATHA